MSGIEPASEPATDRTAAGRAAAAVLVAACIGSVLLVIPSAGGLLYDRFAVPKELLVAIAPLLAGALALLVPGRVRITGETAALAGFLAASAAGVALADNQTLAWRAFAVSAGGVAALLTARRLADRHRGALLVGVGVAAALGAGSVLLEAYGLLPAISMEGAAPGGTEGNRNYMAHVCVAALPLLLVAVGRARGAARAAAVLALLVVAVALVLSRSRGAYLAGGTAVVATVVLTMIMRGGARPRLAAAVLVCAVAVVAAIATPNRLRWASDDPYLDTLGGLADHRRGSGRGRVIQYRNTLDMIAAAPLLGVGPGNWSVAYPAHATAGDPSYQKHGIQPVNRMPTSDWLGLLAERGVLGALLVAAAALLIARACWRELRRGDGGDLAAAGGAHRAAACLASLAGVAVAGAVDAVLLRPTPLVLLAVLVGAAAPPDRPLAVRAWARPIARFRLGSGTTSPAKDSAAVGPSGRPWLAALVAGLALLAALRLYPVAEATVHRWRHHAHGGVEHMERAASATPDDFRLHMILARDWFDRGRCDQASARARLALAAYPHLPLARSILRRCAAPHR